MKSGNVRSALGMIKSFENLDVIIILVIYSVAAPIVVIFFPSILENLIYIAIIGYISGFILIAITLLKLKPLWKRKKESQAITKIIDQYDVVPAEKIAKMVENIEKNIKNLTIVERESSTDTKELLERLKDVYQRDAISLVCLYESSMERFKKSIKSLIMSLKYGYIEVGTTKTYKELDINKLSREPTKKVYEKIKSNVVELSMLINTLEICFKTKFGGYYDSKTFFNNILKNYVKKSSDAENDKKINIQDAVKLMDAIDQIRIDTTNILNKLLARKEYKIDEYHLSIKRKTSEIIKKDEPEIKKYL
jgi:hypothetical protein